MKENTTATSETLQALRKIAEVEGPLSVHYGVLWFEDGTSIDLGKMLGLDLMPKRTTHFKYLDLLKDEGTVNMMGAAPYLKGAFPELSDEDCKEIILAWIDEKEGESDEQD